MALQPSHPLSGKQNGGGAGLQPVGHVLAVCIASPHSHLPECSYTATLRSKEGWKYSLSPRQHVVSQKQNNFCGSFQKGNHHVQKESGLSPERVSKGSLRGSCPLPATSISRTRSRPCVHAWQSSLPWRLPQRSQGLCLAWKKYKAAMARVDPEWMGQPGTMSSLPVPRVSWGPAPFSKFWETRTLSLNRQCLHTFIFTRTHSGTNLQWVKLSRTLSLCTPETTGKGCFWSGRRIGNFFGLRVPTSPRRVLL